MKERMLPASFWLPPPSRPNNNVHKSLAQNELFETRTSLIQITSPPDTNLLFSLFKILEQTNGRKHVKEGVPVGKLIAKNASKLNEHVHRVADDEVNDDDVEESGLIEEQPQLHILDDPYLCIKPEHIVINKKLMKSNESYSDLLSDLVVNL